MSEGSMQSGEAATTASLQTQDEVVTPWCYPSQTRSKSKDDVASILQGEMKTFRDDLFAELRECFAVQTNCLLAQLADTPNASVPGDCPLLEFLGPEPDLSGRCNGDVKGSTQSGLPAQPVIPAGDVQDLLVTNDINIVAELGTSGSRKQPVAKEASEYLMERRRSSTRCHLLTDEEEIQAEDDPDELKLKVDGAFGQIFARDDSDLHQPHFRVEALYSESGCAQAIAKSEAFHLVSLAVISTNAIYLGVDSDYNDATTLYDAHVFFIISENFFCAFFSLELLVRILAFRSKCDCWKDGWFRFDFALVLMMVLETWVMAPMLYFLVDGGVKIPVEPMRLVRLLRLTRMARLMRTMPEIVTMTKGIFISARAVISALMMVLVLVYVHAIVMRLVLEDNLGFQSYLSEEINRNFETIPWCMWTLLIDGTFMSDGAAVIMTELLQQGTAGSILGAIVFMFFMITSAVTVMNMLIGILCRVVEAVSQGEIDDAAIKLVKESILIDLKQFDNGDGMISRHGLAEVMFNPVSKKVLKNLNIDRLFLMELQRMLFPKPDTQVPIKDVMELIVMCRGDLSVTVKSLSSGLSYLSWVFHKFEGRIEQSIEVLQELILERTGFTMAPSASPQAIFNGHTSPGKPVTATPKVSNDVSSTKSI